MSDAHLTIYRAVKLKSNPIKRALSPDSGKTQLIVSTVGRTKPVATGLWPVKLDLRIYALVNIGSTGLVLENR